MPKKFGNYVQNEQSIFSKDKITCYTFFNCKFTNYQAKENTRLSEVVSQNEQLKSELMRHKDADDVIMQLRRQVEELEEKVRMTESKMSDQEKDFESRLQKERDENVETNKVYICYL